MRQASLNFGPKCFQKKQNIPPDYLEAFENSAGNLCQSQSKTPDTQSKSKSKFLSNSFSQLKLYFCHILGRKTSSMAKNPKQARRCF